MESIILSVLSILAVIGALTYVLYQLPHLPKCGTKRVYYDPLIDEILDEEHVVILPIRTSREKVYMFVNQDTAKIYAEQGPKAFPLLRIRSHAYEDNYRITTEKGFPLFMHEWPKFIFGDNLDEGYEEFEKEWKPNPELANLSVGPFYSKHPKI